MFAFREKPDLFIASIQRDGKGGGGKDLEENATVDQFFPFLSPPSPSPLLPLLLSYTTVAVNYSRRENYSSPISLDHAF